MPEKKLFQKGKNQNFLIFSILLSILLIDQLSKWVFAVWGKVVVNPGGFLGIFPGSFWVWLMLPICLGLIISAYRSKTKLTTISLALIAAAGFSNIVDRVMIGGVRDFIYWPVINVYGNLADIILGVGVVIWFGLRRSENQITR